ncbi:MAG TPA: saccharopine dehydrogenase C-terminal domain-containing protein [Parasegetibacter sp.]
MKNILLFGAGRSATCLIKFLEETCEKQNWKLTVCDANYEQILAKLSKPGISSAIALNVHDYSQRFSIIQTADIVISLLPPDLHYLVAEDCLKAGKHLLTASYIDERIEKLRKEVGEKDLLFLCEMGLDPGIDHMSAMQMIHRVNKQGGKITSFISHCGGLVAPENDDNPWRYKISWNARNVVNAGKNGAIYRKNGNEEREDYHQLFEPHGAVKVEGLKDLTFYPNRDSLSYLSLYGLEDVQTFMRTTLRYPEFCEGWRILIELGLTDDTRKINTNGKSFNDCFAEILTFNNKREYYGRLPETLSGQIAFLGLTSAEPAPVQAATAADLLLAALENKLRLLPGEKDMVVMQHDIEYEMAGIRKQLTSELVVKGDDHLYTAMAKTVGLPLGIAAVLVLEGKLTTKGLCIPTAPEIYEPVLAELKLHQIAFTEYEV